MCMEHLRDTVLIPCGHMVLCGECCKDIRGGNGECPGVYGLIGWQRCLCWLKTGGTMLVYCNY